MQNLQVGIQPGCAAQTLHRNAEKAAGHQIGNHFLITQQIDGTALCDIILNVGTNLPYRLLANQQDRGRICGSQAGTGQRIRETVIPRHQNGIKLFHPQVALQLVRHRNGSLQRISHRNPDNPLTDHSDRKGANQHHHRQLQ